MSTEIPKINLELPQGDNRSIQIWHTEIKDGAVNVCISIKEEDSLVSEVFDVTKKADAFKNGLFAVRKLTSGNYAGFDAEYYQKLLFDIRMVVDQTLQGYEFKTK